MKKKLKSHTTFIGLTHYFPFLSIEASLQEAYFPWIGFPIHVFSVIECRYPGYCPKGEKLCLWTLKRSDLHGSLHVANKMLENWSTSLDLKHPVVRNSRPPKELLHLKVFPLFIFFCGRIYKSRRNKEFMMRLKGAISTKIQEIWLWVVWEFLICFLWIPCYNLCSVYYY